MSDSVPPLASPAAEQRSSSKGLAPILSEGKETSKSNQSAVNGTNGASRPSLNTRVSSGTSPANGSATAPGRRAITPPSPSQAQSPGGRAGETGFSTPPGRRSVQFMRSPLAQEVSSEEETPRANARDWPQNVLNRLRSYASPGSTPTAPQHRRRHSDFMIPSRSQLSPNSESDHNQLSDNTYDYESEEEADSEGSEDDEPQTTRVPRRTRRPRQADGNESNTAPTTPRSIRPAFLNLSSHTSNIFSRDRERRPGMPIRRTTVGPGSPDDRMGISEDEGRRRRELAGLRQRARDMRNNNFVTRNRRQRPDDEKRPRAIRRALTAITPQPENANADVTSPSGRKRKRDQLKNLTRLTRKTRKPPSADQIKSAELVAELSAGVPAALIFASMFQADERGHKRIPVLLEQLKIRLLKVDEDEKNKPHERHPSFHIQLEYGNGPTRMTWMIDRSLRDLYKLHIKYRTWANTAKVLQIRSNDKRTKMPHFPNRAFPYLRSLRGFREGLEDSDSEHEGQKSDAQKEKGKEKQTIHHDDTEALQPPESAVFSEKSPALPPTANSEQTRQEDKSPQENTEKSRPSPGFMRRRSSIAEGLFSMSRSNTARIDTSQANWPEQQRDMLEKYLKGMIRFLMFRPENIRLCKFFELSALGIRLAAEGSYHGKEGPLSVYTTAQDLRRSLSVGRNFSKWWMVRHSYIACVESPEDITVTDVLMLDSDFKFRSKKWRPPIQKEPGNFAAAFAQQRHRLKLENSERQLRLLAKNSRLCSQFEASLQHIMETSPWSQTHRFDSFAPVRKDVFVQWLVDGRDHMWNVSRAISMAKDAIYIHDWWLSPELYMRRPAAISREWRLDRLLKRKAEEGVRVFVIVYRNVESAIPINSTYTKSCLLGLHPNIHVQRSPNQMRQGTFFWAHHEKLVIVDHTIAFVGGVDLCFGRWDTPQHDVTDNKLTGFENDDLPKDAEHCQLWPGKDYSNPRVQDFFNLDQPYEEMYNRSQIPRMPWHDISMQLIGQPARDLTRHFVQRWNYILRQRKPSRPTPYLLPPPELEPKELQDLGITGTCEVQLLRSAGMWSIGTPNRTECSIMTAYAKLIQESEHFVYIENQFFITSTRALNDQIKNTVGDALVERIVRAARQNEAWRAVILIPLMPGFQNTVDSQDGTSIRLIMLCQYQSICRGENSIFGRLRKEGIPPEKYIQFYGLRSWGKLGKMDALMTEQLYIHAKCMIVDDRSVIIGSANINERSLLGDRDSEVAAIVRDSDMIWSTMNGKPYEVGRFAHTLRLRLMREHLGLDVDAIALEDLAATEGIPNDVDDVYAGSASETDSSMSEADSDAPVKPITGSSVLSDVGSENIIRPPYIQHHFQEQEQEVGRQTPSSLRARTASVASQQRHKQNLNGNASDLNLDKGNFSLPPPPPLKRANTVDLGFPLPSQLPPLPVSDDTAIGGPGLRRSVSQRSTRSGHSLSGMVNPAISSMEIPEVTRDCMRDPLDNDFYLSIWQTIAENNTLLFRSVFRCMPDNEVRTWGEYREYASYYDRFQRSMGAGSVEDQPTPERAPVSGPPGANVTSDRAKILNEMAEKASMRASQATNVSGGKQNGSVRPQTAGTGSVKVSRSNSVRDPPKIVTDPAPDASHESLAASELPTLHLHASAPPDPTTPPPNSREGASYLRPSDAMESSIGKGQATSTGGPSTPARSGTPTGLSSASATALNLPATGLNSSGGGSQRRRRRAKTVGSTPAPGNNHARGFGHSHTHAQMHAYEKRWMDELLNREVAEEVLHLVQGHLVVWPYDWLIKEEENDNWMYAVDSIAPLEIYN